MTRDEIMALSGRDLDAAVAKHVMGWKCDWCDDEGRHWCCPDCGSFNHKGCDYNSPHYPIMRSQPCDHHPEYSTDLLEAWDVFLRMCGEWPDCNFYLGNHGEKFGISWGFDGHGWDEVLGDRADAPAIICRAALCAEFDV